jgi:hypothetical protein|tara:strand:+ start:1190 stop:1531 length:342 start_codon:yes stop_codon:yes gene_type:complete
MEYTINEIKDIVAKAKKAAYEAAGDYFVEKLDGKDTYPCGFAWVNIHGVKGNTKLGRNMKAAGIEQDYTKAFQIWNPASINVQNVDVKEAGASAAAKVFESFGFKAYAGSRLD